MNIKDTMSHSIFETNLGKYFEPKKTKLKIGDKTKKE